MNLTIPKDKLVLQKVPWTLNSWP